MDFTFLFHSVKESISFLLGDKGGKRGGAHLQLSSLTYYDGGKGKRFFF